MVDEIKREEKGQERKGVATVGIGDTHVKVILCFLALLHIMPAGLSYLSIPR